MVGLMDLGEAAWDSRAAMNHWLEAKKPATRRLLAGRQGERAVPVLGRRPEGGRA